MERNGYLLTPLMKWTAVGRNGETAHRVIVRDELIVTLKHIRKENLGPQSKIS
jgi:hypothetical protein